MNISKVTCIYFSATGLTQKVLDLFLAGLPVPAQKINITPHVTAVSCTFAPDELAVFAAPVYGGVLPKPAAERFSLIKGNHTPAVCLAVYGNRDYDDADAKDLASFARCAWEKLGDLKELSAQATPQVPGRLPYKEFKGVPFKPAVNSACVHCGACAAHCPTGAISKEKPDTTDHALCISCMSCVHICPSHARSMQPKTALWLAEKAFLLKYGKRRELEVFI